MAITCKPVHAVKVESSARKGLRWTPEDKDTLVYLFAAGFDLKVVCEVLERPFYGALVQLVDVGLVGVEIQGRYPFHFCHVQENGTRVPVNWRRYMKRSSPIIQTVTLIDGLPGEVFSDEQIFNRIASVESQIKKLQQIATPSVKIAAFITSLENSAKALAAYVDGR